MADGVQIHCLGLPLQTARPLATGELVKLRRCAASALRRRRFERLLRSFVGIVAGVVAVGFALAYPDEESLALTIAASLGVFAFVLMSGAVLCAFVFARSRLERLAFGFSIVSAITLALYGQALPSWMVSILVAASGIGFIGGIILWSLRSLEARRSAPAWAALPLDIEAGEVLVFQDDESLARVEVLPRSRLRYGKDTSAPWEWERVDIDEVAVPPESPFEWVPHDQSLADDDEYWFRGRKLLTSELDELRRLVRRVPRQATAELLGVLILATSLTKFVAFLWATAFEAQVAGAVWVAVALIVGGRGVRLARDWQALRVDLRHGVVLRARPSGQSPLTTEVLAEWLPESSVLWTEKGQPASWRRQPQNG